MTEQEWLACSTTYPMWEFLYSKSTSQRKLRLYACGCCRFIPEYMESNNDRKGLELTELDVDTALDDEAFNHIEEEWDIRWYRRDGWDAVERATESYYNAAENRGRLLELEKDAHEIERNRIFGMLVAFIRDIFGNPFHPIAINPNWLTSTVVSLATVAYEERKLPSGELDTKTLFQIRLTTSFSVRFEPEALAVGSPFRP